MLVSNRFFKGVVSDTGETDQPPDSMLDSLNTRIIGRDGIAFRPTNLKGHTEKFILPAGYIPLGSEQYNGITYIISLNESTDRVEIGSYPSPDPNTQLFTDDYRPLNNYTGNQNYNNDAVTVVRQNFNVPNNPLFLQCENRIEIKIRTEYDDTVNLYFADNKNKIRVINSGFNHITGEYVDRFTNTFDLENNINLANEARFLANIQFNEIVSGGNVKAGMYFFYVRYRDKQFNHTSFYAESEPIQVPLSNVQVNSGFIIGYGGQVGDDSGASISLNITNLDSRQFAFELGYLYYDGIGSVAEARIIDKEFRINGGSGETVLFTGREAVINSSSTEILNVKRQYIAKSLEHLDNRLYYANLKERDYNHPDLIEYSRAIVIGYDDSHSISQPLLVEDGPSSVANTDNNISYDDSKDTAKYVGYFRNETYCFAIRFIFRDGSHSPPYPLTGSDALGYGAPNGDGIFRFPDHNISPQTDGGTEANILGVTFDFSAATAVFAGSDFIKENVSGYYLCRAERNENLLYQGIAQQLFDGDLKSDEIGNNFNEEHVSKRVIPLKEDITKPEGSELGYVPYLLAPEAETQFIEARYVARDPDKERIGVFSLDYYLDDLEVPNDVFMERLSDISYSEKTFGFADLLGAKTFEESSRVTTSGLGEKQNAKAFNILSYNTAETNEFTSAYDESGGDVLFGGMFAYNRGSTWIINPHFGAPKYIGLQVGVFDEFGIGYHNPYGGSTIKPFNYRDKLINVYRQDPQFSVYTDLYVFKSEQFKAITPAKNLVASEPFRIEYRGDCFLQRVYMRTTNSLLAQGSGVILADTNSAHGVLMSAITENKYNHYMRSEIGTNHFFPGKTKDALTVSATLDGSEESRVYNNGYRNTLGSRAAFGFDENSVFVAPVFPTRIGYSTVHTNEGLQDGYRQNPIGQFKDYDYKYGSINRIMSFKDKLFSFQDRAINMHPVNDRLLEQSSEGQTFILGESNLLPQQVIRLTDINGTQHQFSVVRGRRGIYGIDWNMRSLWRVSDSFELVGEQKMLDTYIHEIIETLPDPNIDPDPQQSDINHLLPDITICGTGVHGVYDLQNKELLFTLLGGEDGKQTTFYFSERIDNIGGRRSYWPKVYQAINQDLYAFKEDTHSFWLHDDNALRNNFFGIDYPYELEFVVSHHPGETKVFDAMRIIANNVDLSQIDYETQHQLATHIIDPSKFWEFPKYDENKWKVSITRAQAVQNLQNNIYEVGSPMRGIWLKIKITVNSNDEFWIKEVQTLIRKSFS